MKNNQNKSFTISFIKQELESLFCGIIFLLFIDQIAVHIFSMYTVVAFNSLYLLFFISLPFIIKSYNDNKPGTWDITYWNQNSFKVYVRIQDLHSKKQQHLYLNLINQAIGSWNKCHNVHLELTNNMSEAQFRIYFIYEPNVTWVGLTENNFYNFSLPITLNLFYLNQYSDRMVLSVIEHELGHGMGLGHSKTNKSVMCSYASNQLITGLDRKTLDQMYS